MSAVIIITFLPNPLPLHNEKVSFISYPLLYLDYFYLSISTFFTSLTAPNKGFPSDASSLCLNSYRFLS